MIGARESNVHALKKEDRRAARQKASALISDFDRQHHAIDCMDLIHLDFNIPEQAVQYKEGSAIWDTCLPAMFQVADWLEKNQH